VAQIDLVGDVDGYNLVVARQFAVANEQGQRVAGSIGEVNSGSIFHDHIAGVRVDSEFVSTGASLYLPGLQCVSGVRIGGGYNSNVVSGVLAKRKALAGSDDRTPIVEIP